MRTITATLSFGPNTTPMVFTGVESEVLLLASQTGRRYTDNGYPVSYAVECFEEEIRDRAHARLLELTRPLSSGGSSGIVVDPVFNEARTLPDPYDERPGPWYNMKRVREIEAATGISFRSEADNQPSSSVSGRGMTMEGKFKAVTGYQAELASGSTSLYDIYRPIGESKHRTWVGRLDATSLRDWTISATMSAHRLVEGG